MFVLTKKKKELFFYEGKTVKKMSLIFRFARDFLQRQCFLVDCKYNLSNLTIIYN